MLCTVNVSVATNLTIHIFLFGFAQVLLLDGLGQAGEDRAMWDERRSRESVRHHHGRGRDRVAQRINHRYADYAIDAIII
jgi:hypothetical protein